MYRLNTTALRHSGNEISSNLILSGFVILSPPTRELLDNMVLQSTTFTSVCWTAQRPRSESANRWWGGRDNQAETPLSTYNSKTAVNVLSFQSSSRFFFGFVKARTKENLLSFVHHV